MLTKEEFFKTHSLFSIEKNTKPNWMNKKYKYYVIEHSLDYKYVLAAIYKINPFKLYTYVLYKEGQPIEENKNLEAIATTFTVLSKGEKL